MLFTATTLVKRAIVLSALAITSALGYLFFVNHEQEDDSEGADVDNVSDMADVADMGDVADGAHGVDNELLDIEEKLMEIRRRLSHFSK
jgi:hypothetical protein